MLHFKKKTLLLFPSEISQSLGEYVVYKNKYDIEMIKSNNQNPWFLFSTLIKFMYLFLTVRRI